MPTSAENVCFLGYFGSRVSRGSGPVLTGDGCVANFNANVSQKNQNIVKMGVNILFNP
jgi:hypothetical protein